MITKFENKCKTCGVSPVIGVILLVSIVVILAAVVGILALGFGDNLTDSSSAAVTVENGKATLVDSGSSEIVTVKNNNNVKGNLTKAGDSISVSNGDVIFSVSEDGSESVLRVIDSIENKFTIIDDFKRKSASDLNTSNFGSNVFFSVVNRNGSDWLNITTEYNGGISAGLAKYNQSAISGRVRVDRDTSSIEPILLIGDISGNNVQFFITNGNTLRINSGGTIRSTPINSLSETVNSPFVFDYTIVENDSASVTLETSNNSYKVNVNGAPPSIPNNISVGGEADSSGSRGSVYFDYIKKK